jgi:VWFA-related protein
VHRNAQSARGKSKMLDERRAVLYIALSWGILFFSASFQPISAKNKGTANSEASPKRNVFKVSTNEVLINASAADKDGNPILDLTVNDFKVYDNNILQNITSFSTEPFGPLEAEVQKNPLDFKSTAKESQKPFPRMISLVIDDLTMESVRDFPRVAEAMKRFVKTNMGAMDQVSILSGSRIVQYPFTNDKKRLLEELDSVPYQLNKLANYHYDSDGNYMSEVAARNRIKIGQQKDEGTAAYYWALRIKEEGEFRMQELFYTIRQNVRVLKRFEGDKLIVLFSDGFPAEQGDREAYQLQEIIDMAVRSGIIMNAVSFRGILFGHSPGTYWASDGNDYDDLDRIVQHSSLIRMAEETGGLFFGDNNIYDHIKAIASRRSLNYILAYAMPPDKPNEDYHKVKLEISRPGAHLSYRKGYSSIKEDVSFDNTKKEDILDAINSEMNRKEIPMRLSYSYSLQNDASYALSIFINANIHKMKFIQKSNRRVNQVSFVVAIFNEAGKYIRGLERLIDFKLQENNYKDLHMQGLSSKLEFKLPQGRYNIKAVVREENEKKIGSTAKIVEIP